MYAVYLHSELLDSVPKSGAQRRLIIDFVRSLAENPETRGDHTDQDDSLRVRQIRIIGKYEMTY